MHVNSSQPRRTRSGNRRDEAARTAVLHAADDLLVEHGFRGLTVEAIARQAGVAKQTIYRWWPSKVTILLDTLVEDTNKNLPVPAEKPTVDSIRCYLHEFARFLTENAAGRVWLALIAEAQHDPKTSDALQDRFLGPRRTQELDMLSGAIGRGEISPKLSPDAALDAVMGPIVYCALTRRPFSSSLVDTLIDDLLRPCAP
ncbi:TetR/AcrR family transcriptional regulator [Streptomyces sp. NPDC088788]|uniref:TetR/AcrR family transcriptional regulator n=1 Tax=Streptomyces sp. NPDC088788 TaxID=3365898 RepID=UPI0037FBC696